MISGCCPVFIALLLYSIILIIVRKKKILAHMALSFVFCFYLVGVLTMTGVWFMRQYAPRIVYMPFADMIRGPVQTVLNFILFIPLGVFLPLLYKEFNRAGRTVLAGFLISLSVEIVQMFGCGTTDINDLITNTAGTWAGYWIYSLLCRFIPKSWLKALRVRGIPGWLELPLYWLGCLAIMITVQPDIFHMLFSANR